MAKYGSVRRKVSQLPRGRLAVIALNDSNYVFHCGSRVKGIPTLPCGIISAANTKSTFISNLLCYVGRSPGTLRRRSRSRVTFVVHFTGISKNLTIAEGNTVANLPYLSRIRSVLGGAWVCRATSGPSGAKAILSTILLPGAPTPLSGLSGVMCGCRVVLTVLPSRSLW